MCSITGHTCYLRMPTFLRGMLYICPYLYNAFDLRMLEETSHHVMQFRRIGNSTHQKYMMQQVEYDGIWYPVASSTLPICDQMRFARHERGGSLQMYTACCCCCVTCTPQKSRRRNQGSIFMYVTCVLKQLRSLYIRAHTITRLAFKILFGSSVLFTLGLTTEGTIKYTVVHER